MADGVEEISTEPDAEHRAHTQVGAVGEWSVPRGLLEAEQHHGHEDSNEVGQEVPNEGGRDADPAEQESEDQAVADVAESEQPGGCSVDGEERAAPHDGDAGRSAECAEPMRRDRDGGHGARNEAKVEPHDALWKDEIFGIDDGQRDHSRHAKFEREQDPVSTEASEGGDEANRRAELDQWIPETDGCLASTAPTSQQHPGQDGNVLDRSEGSATLRAR